jgi:hypothetical protein
MSVNPAAVNAAAAAASTTNAAVEQLISAEINALAAEAQVLQSQVTTGQVVTAQVLPPNGLTDLIQILGNRVAAALPPGLAPGDVFSAQVTGFDGTQILLQVLSTQPAAQSGSGAPPGLETAAVPGLTDEEPPSALQLAATRPLLPDGVSASIAPPPAVFVAASVRQASATDAVPTTTTPLPANLPPPPPSQVIAQAPGVLSDIEARLTAARAGSVGIEIPNVPAAPPPAGLALPPSAPPPSPPAQPPAATAANATPAPTVPQPNTNAAPPPLLSRFSFPPPITQSARFADAAGNEAPPASNAPSPAPAGLAAFRDPAALVRALSLPVTPTNVAAAKMALDTPQRLPAALATLENALPDVNDPRVATLRTLSAFIGRLDPSSPQLAAQISAYVDNVVTGNEPKLVQLLTAQLAAETPAAPPPAAAPGAAAPPAAGAAAPAAAAPAPIVPETPLAVLALAQIAERGAALSVDLKTQLLAVINAPPAGTEDTGDLIPAASSALSAITAVQMNAAQAMNATPQTMAFTLPMWLGSGYAQAHIAVDRDAPEPGGKRNLDGDNFHIAFILDTQHLGTVSVDLQTVGRAFSLAVKTESETTAKRFAESLTTLTARLEKLRYRINSAEATVAARGAPAASTTAPAVVDEPQDDTGTGTDVNVRA